ncbi:MAG: beta strand repeat-containing protein, partial [Gaiellaceae bacterium]
ASVRGVSIAGGGGNDTLAIDSSVLAAMIPVAFDGGGGLDTVAGPAADTTWNVTGAGSGSAGSLSFAGVESLAGAAGNKDTFVVARGASIDSVDGGEGGWDVLKITGDTYVSTPTGKHSGKIKLDGRNLRYDGLEPVDVTAASITINGADLGGNTELGDKDVLRVSPYTDGGTCAAAGSCIQIQNFLGPFGVGPEIAELNFFTIAGTTSVTIDAGLGTDSIEFTGDFLVPGATLVVRAETIKVLSGVTIDVGTGDITFDAITKDNGISLVGITTTIPVLGAEAKIDVDGATLVGNDITLRAFSGTLATTVNGGGQSLAGGTLTVASVAGFADDGTFDVVGGTGTCVYTGRNTGANQFTGLSGCTGTPADGAVVRKDLVENGSDTGFRHAGLELEYYATVDVHGASTITATGDVTLASSVDVTASARAASGPDKGNWVSGTAYTKGDVVTDTTDSKKYAATKDMASSTTAPSGDTGLLGNWAEAEQKDASVVAVSVIAIGTSKLSDTSTISAASGAVALTSNVKTSIASDADSSSAGSGAGIAVAVLVTTSEAFVDSSAATPVSAQSLTLTADTDNTAPTTAKSSSKGTTENDQSANSAGRANGNSQTSDGNQDLTAALAVTILVASTQAYISPSNANAISIGTGAGAQTIHAGASNKTSAIADAGNVKFSPDAPTLTASAGGSLADNTTYFYKVTAVHASGESLASPEAQLEIPTGSANKTINLSWTAVPGATGYKVYRSTATGEEKLLATLGAVTAYADDGSASLGTDAPPTTSPTSGIGIAVAVNVADVTTKASVSKNVTLTGSGVTLEATQGSGPSTTKAQSTSGAGGSSVGVAGSIAINILVAEAIAQLEGADPIAVNGDLTLTSSSSFDNQALALAKQSSDGSASGVGASFALNVVNDTTTAGLPDGTAVTGVQDLTITAVSTDTSVTTAEGGASAGSGSLALSAQVAVSISNVTTSASVGTLGSGMTIGGGLTAQATQTAKTTTTAKGATKGATAGIGLSLGLALANHLVDSQLRRSLTAGGNVSFTADGSSSNDTQAAASSAGAEGKSGSGDEDTDSSGQTPNQKANSNLETANTASTSNGGQSSGSSSTPEASSGENGGTTVTVAAAVAIGMITSSSIAKLADNLTLTTTGSAKFKTSAD